MTSVLFPKHPCQMMLIILRFNVWIVLAQFAGKWYRVGLAYDSPGFVPYRSRLTISMGIVEPKENGDVNMTMWSLRWGDTHFQL